MRKLISILLSCACVFCLLAGCGNNDTPTTNYKASTYIMVNNFDGATMSIVQGTVTPIGLTVEFTSSNENECIYGTFYCLEFNSSGKWYQVPYSDKIKSEVAWTKEGYTISKGESQQFSENWEWLYGRLGTGHYRIVKDISDFRGTGDYDAYNLAAEFTIE